MSQKVIQVWNDSPTVVSNLDNFISNCVTLCCPLDKMRFVIYSKDNPDVIGGLDELLKQYRLKKITLPVEEAFARLEQLIRRMESEDISLEDSFACYEQGIRLVRYCNERIDQVEKKVQILRGEGFSQSPPDSREG